MSSIREPQNNQNNFWDLLIIISFAMMCTGIVFYILLDIIEKYYG